ncbi:hypothetical protein F511_30113 [Dorcoceras hygrometricum]|uniref:Uncharacterized protein n=1 Tax=Dorcoceras hygrometricum TaxID=472368 RepID=A0A2Z7C7T0_9LAMI|nr:hypothetical protein F511_30113 [Dorcoceras hygrometricum]
MPPRRGRVKAGRQVVDESRVSDSEEDIAQPNVPLRRRARQAEAVRPDHGYSDNRSWQPSTLYLAQRTTHHAHTINLSYPIAHAQQTPLPAEYVYSDPISAQSIQNSTHYLDQHARQQLRTIPLTACTHQHITPVIAHNSAHALKSSSAQLSLCRPCAFGEFLIPAGVELESVGITLGAELNALGWSERTNWAWQRKLIVARELICISDPSGSVIF